MPLLNVPARLLLVPAIPIPVPAIPIPIPVEAGTDAGAAEVVTIETFAAELAAVAATAELRGSEVPARLLPLLLLPLAPIVVVANAWPSRFTCITGVSFMLETRLAMAALSM